jgi:hypothetical protein
MPLDTALKTAIEIADAPTLRSVPASHRDVKPGNIILTRAD